MTTKTEGPAAEKAIEFTRGHFRCKLVSQAYAEMAGPRDADEVDIAGELSALLELEHMARTDQAVRRFVAPALAKLDALRAKASEAAAKEKTCAEFGCIGRVGHIGACPILPYANPPSAYQTPRDISEWRCPQCGDTVSGTGCVACAYKRAVPEKPAQAEQNQGPSGQKESNDASTIGSDSDIRDGRGRAQSDVHREANAGGVSARPADEPQRAKEVGSEAAPSEQEEVANPAGERGGFRVGQRVRVCREANSFFGVSGTVTGVDGPARWPILVELDNGSANRYQAIALEPADPAPPQLQGDGVTRAELCRLFRGVNIRAFDEIADRLERRPP